VNTTYDSIAHTAGSSGRLKDQPAGERPRERLIERGAQALSPAELVAILVRTGLRGTNALDIGKQLVCKFGSLGAMARASVDDLRSVRGIGRDKAVTLVAAFTLASKIAEELQRESPVLDNPEAVAGLLRDQNRLMEVETFQILLLNTRRRLIRAGQFIKIEVVDHVILGRATVGRPKDYSSLRDLGYFYS
jgi:DNA repair protein RadC